MSTVHLVVPDWFDDPDRPSGGSAYDRRLAEGLPAAGWSLRVVRTPTDGPREGSAALRQGLAGVPDGGLVLVDGLVALADPDALHAACRRLRVVVVVHMPATEQVHGPGAVSRERAALASATAVVVTSEWTRQALVDRLAADPARVHVARPGVERAEVATRSRTGQRLLCVAAVTPVKGHDVLVAALAAVADRDWTCLCAGALDRDPGFVRRVRALTAGAGLSERVRLAGPLDAAALGDAYAHADLLLLPSRLESFGMVVTEAVARGVPVFASRVGGLPGTLAPGPRGVRPGLLLPPGDPLALGAAVRRWLEDPDLRARLRRAAVDRRRTLPPWGPTVDAVDRVLRRVAA